MSRLDGRDVWPGNYASPVEFYRARRMRVGREMRWLDDPIKGMHVALAEWAGEPVPSIKGSKRRYRRWRLTGLIRLTRELTPAEAYEFDKLLVAVLADSGWLPRIAADRSLAEPAIAEGLRVTTPSPVMLRSVVARGAIGEVAVRPGDRVILATYAANRALGEFDPGTNVAAQLKQLWFGAGTHFCLGAPLAMAQIRLTLDALLDAGELRIVSRAPARGVLIPSYARLLVERSRDPRS